MTNTFRKGVNMADFEFVDDGEFEYARRGRKTETDQALLDALAALAKAPKGKRLALKAYAGDPTDAETYGLHRAKVSAHIRKHAKVLGMSVTIQWSLTGVPTVARKAK